MRTMELTKVGHETERGERFTVYMDKEGAYWTYDPDYGGGMLCPCFFGGWTAAERKREGV